jgi:hypothetical protein
MIYVAFGLIVGGFAALALYARALGRRVEAAEEYTTREAHYLHQRLSTYWDTLDGVSEEVGALKKQLNPKKLKPAQKKRA